MTDLGRRRIILGALLLASPLAGVAQQGRRGNVTGLTGFYEATPVKMIELAAALVPRGARVTALLDVNSPFYRGEYRAEFERGAEAFGLRVDYISVASADELSRAFASLGKRRPAMVVMPAGSMVFALGERVVAGAREFKLPIICAFEEWTAAGVLMSYAIDIPESYRRAATYVDRILRGANPAELPIEQPTRLSLAVNLTTAKQLGVAIPSAVLARADRVIE